MRSFPGMRVSLLVALVIDYYYSETFFWKNFECRTYPTIIGTRANLPSTNALVGYSVMNFSSRIGRHFSYGSPSGRFLKDKDSFRDCFIQAFGILTRNHTRSVLAQDHRRVLCGGTPSYLPLNRDCCHSLLGSQNTRRGPLTSNVSVNIIFSECIVNSTTPLADPSLATPHDPDSE